MKNENKEYKPFIITTAKGFIGEIRKHKDNYYIDLSLITGKAGDDANKNRLQYVSLFVSNNLKNLAEKLISGEASLSKIYCEFIIHNMHFEIDDFVNDTGKNTLKVSGILVGISIRS